MGILSRILGRDAPAPVERRDAFGTLPGFAEAFGIHPRGAAPYISATAAENLASIACAVSAISSAVASLQPIAYQRAGAGRTELQSPHWLPRLLRQPAPRTSWCDWIETQMAGALLAGNAVAVIESDAGGRVVALHPVPWSAVTLERLPNGRPRYAITDTRGAWGRANAVHRFLESEVWHLADRREPGELAARPRLGRVGGAIANAMSLQDMTAAAWRNAMHVSGYIAAPNVLNDHQRGLADAMLSRFRGAREAGKTPVLEGGLRWESLQINAESLQTLESRKFSVIEVARVFNVPPPLLQSYENNTFTNAAQASLWFGMFCIAPWAKKVESAISTCILGAQSDLAAELDMSSLLRGSHAERWEANRIAIETGVLSPDEVRLSEGWGPRGDAGAADRQQRRPASAEPAARRVEEEVTTDG